MCDPKYNRSRNHFGYDQFWKVVGDEKTPVCSSCFKRVSLNTGEGTICNKCKESEQLFDDTLDD